MPALPSPTVKLPDCQLNWDAVGKQKPYCILSISANQSYAPGSTIIGWTSEIADPFALHTMPAGTSIVVNKSGLWFVVVQAVLNITPAGASTWNASLLVNGSAPVPISCSTLMSAVGFNYYANCSGPVMLKQGDALSVQTSHNAGVTGSFVTTSMFAAYYTGAV